MNRKKLKIEYKEEGREPSIKTEGDPIEIVVYFIRKLNIENQVFKELNKRYKTYA